MADKKTIQLCYNINGRSGTMFKPESIQFVASNTSDNITTTEPHTCLSDALTGLSAWQLVQHQMHGLSGSTFQNEDITHIHQEFWTKLDIGSRLFERMHHRGFTKGQLVSSDQQKWLSQQVNHICNLAITADKNLPVIDVTQFGHLIDVIDRFEASYERPLIFNFDISFDPNLRSHLLKIYSLLYNLRSLVVLDYNSHLSDRSNDSIKMDRISNYLPNPEYIVNDAILWARLKQTLKAYKPENIEEYFSKVINESKNLAQKWMHNGYYLQVNTPEDWYTLEEGELQDELYNAQMQWLLGTDSGLLFRIREESYAISEGYDRIFYPDVSSWNAQKMEGLQMNCVLDEKHLDGIEAEAS